MSLSDDLPGSATNGLTSARRSLRLVHGSDCHLGASAEMGRNEHAFAELIDSALKWRADAILLAGDVFDTARVGDEILRWAATQLCRFEGPVVILPGNHDLWAPSAASVYGRLDFEKACDNVHVITEPRGEVIHLSELDLAVWGRPVMDHAPSFRPLADPPPRPEAGWAVAMGHGFVVSDDSPTDRGSPIYRDDLDALMWDYVALGHWGSYWEVRSGESPACYAGPTAGHWEWPPGAVLVDLDPERPTSCRRLAFGTPI